MADEKLTIEQSMGESAVSALHELVAELRGVKVELQHLRVQVTTLAATQARRK